MVEIGHIEAIPTQMLNRIKELDEELHPTPYAYVRFYTYFTKYNNELCSVTVAVKQKKNNWHCKQVVIHGIHNEYAIIRDIYFMFGGNKVGWYRDGLTNYPGSFDYDWSYTPDEYYQISTSTIVNKEYILTIPKYKNSSIDKYRYNNVFEYLRLCEQNPICEVLVAAGLDAYATSKQIITKCNADKHFTEWLLQNKEQIAKHCYYNSVLLTTYTHNLSLQEVEACLSNYKISRY